jgi:hypothetical protein
MKKLYKLTNEEICEFLLNGKQGDCLELNPKHASLNPRHPLDFIEHMIYKDKNVQIIYSFLKIAKDDVIQQFFIYSNWWGKIKNSFFTLEGFKGKSEEEKCGVINITELNEIKLNSDLVPVNNKNQICSTKVKTDNPIIELAEYCQKHFKQNIETVVSIDGGSQHEPVIKADIIIPNGEVYSGKGKNQKEAKQKAAILALESIK